MRKRSGFSLLELIVVMAVIAIFVAMGAPKLLGNTKQANVTTLNADIRTTQTAVDHYYQGTGKYPVVEGEEGLQPTLGVPVRLDFSQLKSQLQRNPQTAGTHYWWVDHNGTVYASSLDAPDKEGWSVTTGVFSLDEGLANGYTAKGATVYLYEGTGNNHVAFNAPLYALATSNPVNSGLKLIAEFQPSDTYPVSVSEQNCYVAVKDKKGFITPPVGKGYKGIELLEPTEPEKKNESLRDPVDGELVIETVKDLQKVGTGKDGWTLSEKYILMSDLDLTGLNWEPIGTSPASNSFQGTFDGNGHVIKNLTVDQEESYAGLFGRTTGAKITNLGLENANVKGGKYTGGLVGSNYGAITNCYATNCEVTGTGSTGGLVGYNYATITNCYATNCKVTGTENYTGGLVGSNYGAITNCYATNCEVTSTENCTGGLVGYNYATITNCYATNCEVTSTGSYTGGLVGYNNASGTITNCYATNCKVTGTGSTGGLVGGNWDATISRCYWNKETINQTSSEGGIARTTAQMMKQSTYSGWSFRSIWAIDEGTSYPYLQSNEQIPHPGIN